jgi:hypothetical protein
LKQSLPRERSRQQFVIGGGKIARAPVGGTSTEGTCL